MTLAKTEAHSQEAWTLAWASKGAELYSGGDDSALCRHILSDRPVSESPKDGDIVSHENNFQTPLRDTHTHMAGVTAILPLQYELHAEKLLLTGSYDEYVRLLLPIDGHARPKVLAEKKLGGGVWSLKILEKVAEGPAFRILASCMHAGSRILEVRQEGGKWLIDILAKFVEHESMNYASAGRPRYGTAGVEGFTIVSTSFYDKKLCVWEAGGCRPGQ